MQYPVKLTKDDNGTFLVTFPDVPAATTFGDTVDEALERGVDALLTVFDALIRDRQAIPEPSTIKTKYVVEVPALETTKLALYRTMRKAKVNKAELGRRLNVHLPQVDRLLDVRHASQLSQVEAAFQAMGKRLRIQVTDPVSATRSTRVMYSATGQFVKRDRPEPRAVRVGSMTSARLGRVAAKKR